MQAYAAYRRPQNIEFYSIRKKNTRILAYVKNNYYLCSRKRKRTNTILIIINLIKHNYNYGAYNI